MTAAVLTIGILALSSAAILIRESEASALVTAFYRVLFSAVLLAPFVSRRVARARKDVDWVAVLVAGSALAFHFWAWMRSLELTSVASSTLLVTTTPFWIALVAPWLRDEQRMSSAGWFGVVVSLSGAGTIAAGIARGGHSTGPEAGVSLVGLVLATVGAWLMATYLIAGRRARRVMDVGPFALLTNLVAALVLASVALASGEALGGFDRRTLVVLVALAAVPQLIGHNALLWAVRSLGASVVALVVLLEPVGASALAWALLSEVPTRFDLAGGTLLLLGLAIVIRSRTPERPERSFT